MTLAATDMEIGAHDQARTGPVVDSCHWGYSIRCGSKNALRTVIAGSGRFVGTILLMAAAGLLLLPDTAHAPELVGMKLAAMVVFTVIGVILFIAGLEKVNPEIQVDTSRGEVRVGRRGLRGAFKRNATVRFSDVTSVYLLRTKDRSQPARLFLRLTAIETAIEVAHGPERMLEALREILARDLARDPRQPVTTQLHRHARLAA